MMCFPVTPEYRAGMTVQPAHAPSSAPKWPAKTLGDVDRTIRTCATEDVVAEFQAALDKAWAAAREQNALQPLLNLVEGWWPQAVFWSEPGKACDVMARVEDVLANGLPADRKRFGPAELEALIERKRLAESRG